MDEMRDECAADETGIAETGIAEEGIAEEGDAYALSAGEDFPVPEENLRAFCETCRAAGLSQRQAQAVLDWHKERYADDEIWRQQQEARTLESWRGEIMADREFGGANWQATKADAVRGFTLVDPDGSLRAFLRETKYQHNPMVIRAMARVGRAMGEHGFVRAEGAGSRSRASLEERLWPDMNL